MDIEEKEVAPAAPVKIKKYPANTKERFKKKRREWMRTPAGRRWRRLSSRLMKKRQREMPERMNRHGIVNGSNRAEAKEKWRAAIISAKETMTELLQSAAIPVPKTTDEMAAYEALEKSLIIMRSPVNVREQLAAAKIVLDFTKAKPAQKQDITVSSTESWLKQVIEDDKE